MKAKMRRFCVVCLSAGMVVVLIAMTYTLPDKTLLGAALVGFWAALATLGGLAALWLFDYARKQAGKKKCAGTTVLRQDRGYQGGNVVPVKSKESLPARM